MSNKDNPLKPHSNEEEYFRRKNAEAIDAMKKADEKKAGAKTCDGNCKGCEGKCDPATCPGKKDAKKAAPKGGKTDPKGGCGCQ